MNKQSSTPISASSTAPRAQHPSGLLNRLRAIPRWFSLSMSAAVLLIGSILWFALSPDWDRFGVNDRDPQTAGLNTPWIRSRDAALPDISARLFAIDVQLIARDQTRLWIGGAKGFLAASDDGGRCWKRYNYQSGVFAAGASNCQRADIVPWKWPELIPTAWAAPPEMSQASQGPPRGAQQSGGRQSSPAIQGALNPVVQSDDVAAKAREPEPQLDVFPKRLDFGDVFLGDTSRFPLIRESTITNVSKTPVKISLSGIMGDKEGEFFIKDGCNSQLDAGQKCPVTVGFSPRSTGDKRPQFAIETNTSLALTVYIFATVNAPATVQNKPVEDPDRKAIPPIGELKATPPQDPPDVLGFQFTFGTPEMLSTSGVLWELKGEAWHPKPVRDGAIAEKFNGRNWHLVAASNKSLAQTFLNPPDNLTLDPAPFGCQQCEMRSEILKDAGSDSWAAGWTTDGGKDHAIIFHSVDRGAHWLPATLGALSAKQREALANAHAWRWPPSWYWAFVFAGAGFAAIALIPPAKIDLTTKVGNIEGTLASDRPLVAGDVDVLGLTSIALGISRFLRNEKTLPPLTVAINGEWGSGKSSLMNLLKSDLQSYGMKPVWFNAWHHQKEEHLLAALLQTVRMEAVPPLWNLLGLPFRARLLWYRVRRRWPTLISIAAASIFFIVVDWHLRSGETPTDLMSWLLGQILPSQNSLGNPITVFPLQGSFVALIATIAALWKGVSALGANPAALLASVAQGNKLKDLDAQTSFRQRFAVEFRDFTNALGPKRPLVIFIDDLDRCLPDNVREVLEAINFLVTSGDCFIVLGIDREQVQRAIGLSFKDVAEESSASKVSPTTTAADSARVKRSEFAQKYLQKLINIEVRVPIAADEPTRQRLFRQQRAEVPEVERRVQSGLALARRAVPVMLAALLLVGAYELGVSSVPAIRGFIEAYPVAKSETAENKKTDDKSAASSQTKTTPPPADSNRSRQENPPVRTAGILVEPMTGVSNPAIQDAKSLWPARWILSMPLYLVAMFLLVVFNVVLTTRPGVVTHDSPAFSNALEQAWYPLILAQQNTPRAAKRFVNRVRYLAMRQQTYGERVQWWDRMIFPQRLREPEQPRDWAPIPEHLLVAMAAIEQLEDLWVYQEQAFKYVSGDDFPNLKKDFPGSMKDAVSLLEAARGKHRKLFPDDASSRPRTDWPSLTTYRPTFLQIWPKTEPDENPSA